MEIRIVFDGPPSHESGRFIEVEDESGRSIRVGEWRERQDRLWELVIGADAMNARRWRPIEELEDSGTYDLWVKHKGTGKERRFASARVEITPRWGLRWQTEEGLNVMDHWTETHWQPLPPPPGERNGTD